VAATAADGCESTGRSSSSLLGSLGRCAAHLLFALALLPIAARGGEVVDPRRGPAIYVLSGAPGRTSALDVLHSRSGETLAHSQLEQAGASALALDRSGRVWVGRKSAFGSHPASIDIVGADLKHQTQVPTAENPGVGVAFSHGKALIACSQRGLGGALTAVDLESLSVQTIEVDAPKGGTYILTALAASEQKIVLAGMTSGPDPKTRYAAITVIDPRTLKTTWRSQPLENVDIWQIIPHDDMFILLNVASGEGTKQPRSDSFFLSRNNALVPFATAPAALWGAVRNGVLYTYHNPTHNSLRTVPERSLSTYNLATRKLTVAKLPDYIDAADLTLADDRLMLSVKSATPAYPSGVYTLGLNGADLRLLAKLPGAGKLALGPTRN
jgi:hypothetical protein